MTTSPQARQPATAPRGQHLPTIHRLLRERFGFLAGETQESSTFPRVYHYYQKKELTIPVEKGKRVRRAYPR